MENEQPELLDEIIDLSAKLGFYDRTVLASSILMQLTETVDDEEEREDLVRRHLAFTAQLLATQGIGISTSFESVVTEMLQTGIKNRAKGVV